MIFKYLIQNINSKKNKFTLYYEDWCGYSRKMLPEWNKLEETNSYDNINIEKIKCSNNKELCKNNNITSYPTIIYTNNIGQNIEYNGKRTYQNFLNFLNKHNNQ